MKRAPIKELNALGDLKDQLKARAVQEQLAEQERLAREKVAQKEASLFRSNIGAVTPIKATAVYQHQRPSVAVPAAARKIREIHSMADAMEEIEQWSDEFDPANSQEDAGASYAIKGSGPELLARLRSDKWPVQAFIDLHGMQRDQARTTLADFLRRSKLARLRCVCVIHGKGINSRDGAVLPVKVRSWLGQSELVQAFCPAQVRDGGSGALQVLLKAEATK